MEAYKTKQVRKGPAISVGDVCILRNDQTKRAFWKLCRESELLTGNDDDVRAAKVEVTASSGKQVFRRLLQHLIPLEITTSTNDLHEQPAKDTHVHEGSIPAASVDRPAATAAALRPKRNAAIIGVLCRQDGLVRQ